MGLVGITWEGTGAHGMSEGSVTVRVRVQELSWGRRCYSAPFWRETWLLDVIMNGDAPAAIASVSGGIDSIIPPITTKQKIARRNELKAKSTLLLAILDEHLLKFHGIKDVKTLWEAIKTRVRGNKESKKIQKTILKQQYENFAASRSEGLDKTYDRFQKLINQLEIHGEVISLEDANLKLLRSLPPAWNTHTLIMRNKSDRDTLSMDALYKNLKVYEAEIKGQSSSNSNSQNSKLILMTLRRWISNDRRCHFARECRVPRSQEKRNRDNTRRVVPIETPVNALFVTDGMGYDWSYQAEEGPTDFALMAFSSSDKTGLGYDSQLNERDLNNKNDVFESAADSSVNESEEDNNQVNDRYKAGEGYHAVPPPYTGTFMPSRPNLSFAGLDDSVFKSAISETVTNVHETETSTSKISKESIGKPKTVGSSAPIIEDWESDSDDDYEIRPSIQQNKPKKYVLNNEGKATGQKEVRPVWNNAKRVNHPNFSNNLTHPHPRRNFVPIAVITNLGKIPVNAAKQSSPRAAASTNTARYVNTATNRPTVNGIKPSSNVFHKSHSPVRRTFNQRTAPKHSDLKEKINTAEIKAVVSVVHGNRENNRGLVTKPHNKTPYEPLIGRSPNLDIVKPFGCPVTIFNTLDHLGKFEGKADEGFLVGYSVNSKAFKSSVDKDVGEVPDKGDEGLSKESGINDQEKTDSSTQDVDTAEPSINNASTNINTGSLNINTVLEETGIFDDVYADREVGSEADTNNLELSIVASPISTTTMHKDHPKKQIIGDLNLTTQTRKMLNFSKENSMVSYINKQRRTNYKDYHNCLFACFLSQQEPKKVIQALADPSWIEAMQEELLQFKLQKRGTIDKTLFIKKDKDDAQEILNEFYGGTHFLLRVASKVERWWNLHQPRQTSHLHAVKRIFRYLKGQPKLGLWYPRDSPFDLEAFSNSDYARASLDRKSTTGGCQFLGKRLISWQCKKQTIVSNSTTEAEYVAAANCYGQVLWIQNQLLDYGFNFMNTKIYIDNESSAKQYDWIGCDNTKDLRITLGFNGFKLFFWGTNTFFQLCWQYKQKKGTSTGGSLRCQEIMRGSIAQTRPERVPTPPHDSPLLRVNILGSDEGSMSLQELTALCTTLSDRVLALETDLRQTKKVYGTAYTKLIMKYSRPEDQLGFLSAAKVLADVAKKKEGVKDKGKAIMQESGQPKKIKRRVQIQMSLDEELAQNLYEKEQARFNVEQEAKFNAEQEELLASETTKDEANPSVTGVD
uniref:Putative reverse transcriptase, RNA-dependent DNA polymerase n=1 Tax=Tanacetum cinerariifolium TaxID=118510 RepID=A0A6L2LQN1_TANCI|nr:putative reverse transcriptase, RNA-dependent DNA polymerase [Tanacetum cinerariifolium]